MISVIISTVVFTYTMTPEYQSRVRLVLKPAATTANIPEQRATLSTLSKPVVANTYAEIAQSSYILQSAWDQLEVPLAQRKGFEVSGSTLQNTNIIIITVVGPDPLLVQELAATTSQLTFDYITELYEVYDLKLLDPASLPSAPISPNKKLNLVLGVVLGLGFGILCAFLASYLMTPLEETKYLSIVDAQTGAYKGAYFLRRLRGEISRAKRVQRPFVIGMIRLENLEETMGDFPSSSRQLVLKQVVHSLKQTLPEEDLVAQWRGDDLVLLMPDIDLKTAQRTLERLQTKLAWTAFEVGDTGFKVNFIPSFGLVEYDLNGTGPEGLLEEVEKALQEADGTQNGHHDEQVLNLDDENTPTFRIAP